MRAGRSAAAANGPARAAGDRPVRAAGAARHRDLSMMLAALLLATPATAKEPPMHHATGSFEVKVTPEAQALAPEGGLPTARMAIAKTFSGAMTGTATGTMISAGTPAPGHVAAYVAVDQFRGSVDGRAGGFLLLHRGTIAPDGASDLSVEIAPGSGTGALAGIAGTLAIRQTGGVHEYDLSYTLPAG